MIFDKSIYSNTAIRRALSNYANELYVKIENQENSILVEVEPKDSNCNLKIKEKEIFNAVLEEETRCMIEEETKNVRELICERAMKFSHELEK